MVTDAESSLVEIAYAEQDSWDTIPTSKDMQVLRTTGESLSQDADFTTSDELRQDGQIPERTRTSVQAGGDINGKLSYGTYDTWFEHALRSTFSTELGLSGQIDADSTNDTFVSDSTGSGVDMSEIETGQWIKTSGFTDSDLNDYWYVTAVDTSTDSAHEVSVRSSVPTDETGDGDEAIDGSFIRNGVDKKLLYLEKYFSDIGEYNYYPGCRIDGFQLNATNQSLVELTFSTLGKEELTDNQSSQGAGWLSTNSNPIFNTGENILRMIEGGNDLPAQEFSLGVENSVRTKGVLGQPTTRETGIGDFDLTGSLSAYLNDQTLYKKWTNADETDFSIILEDPDGNAYIMTIFRANLTDGSEEADGPNDDVIQDFDYGAQMDDDAGETDKTFQIDKFSA